MQKIVSLKLTPSQANQETLIRELIAQSLAISPQQVNGYTCLKQSIDARSRQQVWINTSLLAFIDEPFIPRKTISIQCKEVKPNAKKVLIVGAGPAGLFAALQLLEMGLKPIIIERGKDVRSRRRDLAKMNKEGLVNPESNYCFGEGGAGTYSDGKLYTRSSKRGDINRILGILHQFGAEESILYQAHPHIGTNKLPHIITAIRQAIVTAGGAFHFEKKMVGLCTEGNLVKAVKTSDGDQIFADAFILATGHSARDIFHLLKEHSLAIEAKPFALGVRIEHPQQLIDSIQYHCKVRDADLPPASYGLVEQVNHRGVFSFCMCPGGIIAPAATAPGELVVNGWSPSKIKNPYANSGMVVQVGLDDAIPYLKKHGMPNLDESDPLSLLYFQQSIEQKAFLAGGSNLQAPAQRMLDFCQQRISSNLPNCSYLPGVKSADLSEVLPPFILNSLQEGFKAFGKRMKGYYTQDAIVVATESRTSSPVRIPRDPIGFHHPQLMNLYPCAEGAGYAGGIVSAAMDGENVARSIIEKFSTALQNHA